MLQDHATLRMIATFWGVVALAGGLAAFNKTVGATETPTVVATSCSGFVADAQKLFDKGGSRSLSGTFAPGDHVHLTIDFKGVGYSWKLTGALGAARTDLTGSGSFDMTTTSTSTETTTPKSTPTFIYTDTTFAAAISPAGTSISTPASTTPDRTITSAEAHGDIGGLVRMQVDADVAEAGVGAITINAPGLLAWFMSPRVVSASCNATNRRSRCRTAM